MLHITVTQDITSEKYRVDTLLEIFINLFIYFYLFIFQILVELL